MVFFLEIIKKRGEMWPDRSQADLQTRVEGLEKSLEELKRLLEKDLIG